MEKCSNEYEKYIPHKIANFPYAEINDDDKQILEKIYTDKFVNEKSIGRKYYNIIMRNANGRCPICGGGKVKNLDHFLPKSKYPLLCVTAINLVPTCRDCNMEKGAAISDDYYAIPFHPYLETMDDIWIECELFFYSDGTFTVNYKNGYDKTKNPELWKKYNAHMRITDLNMTFISRAEEEIENVREMYKGVLLETGTKGLIKELKAEKDSAEKNDVNSYKAALYRALLKECEKFGEWLRCE